MKKILSIIFIISLTACSSSKYVMQELDEPVRDIYTENFYAYIYKPKGHTDEEFKEFPSVDRLNRTMMHLKYVKKGKPYLTGTVENGYSLTNFGKATALEVESIINHSVVDKSIKAPVVDKHKKGFGKDYVEFINSDGYKKYLATNKIDIMFIWEFYNVIPYTQIKFIKNSMENIKEYANELKDAKCIQFINEAQKKL